MPKTHTSELDAFVAAVNSTPASFKSPDVIERFTPLDLIYDAEVNQNLSPYSNEYYNQQLELYREISGRVLNQEEGELHPVDTSLLLNAANPIGLQNVEDAAEHVRNLSTMLSLANLSGSPRVLDMGAGHGLSSEIYAFSGCKVHAVDIDPVLGELSRARAAARGLDIVRSDINFDDLSEIENNAYAAAFFFQSLHHCLRPWELIERLKEKLTSDGIIGFVGEPINTYWWKHWGIRLDEVSLFVAREHGWFESGWSHEFIRDCFARCNMDLKFYTGGYAGGEIGLATRSAARSEDIATKARLLGLAETHQPSQTLWVDERRYASLVGTHGSLLGIAAFRQISGAQGVLLYGPYIALEAGSYEISLLVKAPRTDMTVPCEMVFDIVHDMGTTCLLKETFAGHDLGDGRLIVRRIDIADPVQQLEIRVSVSGGDGWMATLPTIRTL